MRKELDDELCAKYPKIFAKRNLPMTETCMCWGFDHGDGWYNIINQLCSKIQSYINHSIEENAKANEYVKMVESAKNGDFSPFEKMHDWVIDKDQIEKYRRQVLEESIPDWRLPKPVVEQVVAAQVKEKYGTLHFYYDGGDQYIRGLVDMAGAMSGVTCEECGAPGRIRSNGWIRVLCDEHAVKFNYTNVRDRDDN